MSSLHHHSSHGISGKFDVSKHWICAFVTSWIRTWTSPWSSSMCCQTGCVCTVHHRNHLNFAPKPHVRQTLSCVQNGNRPFDLDLDNAKKTGAIRQSRLSLAIPNQYYAIVVFCVWGERTFCFLINWIVCSAHLNVRGCLFNARGQKRTK